MPILLAASRISTLQATTRCEMAFYCNADEVRARAIRDCFSRELPDLRFVAAGEPFEPEEVQYILTWKVIPELRERYRKLEVVFSLGAGVDQLRFEELPQQAKLVRLIEPGIIALMQEYVVMATLALHRDLPIYLGQRAEAEWIKHPIRPAFGVRVGVMGLGQLGQAVLRALAPFGFELAGWSRTPRAMEGVSSFAGDKELAPFLARTDILICLLPLTNATHGILSRTLLAQLPMGAGLVHVGRGQHLDQDALLEALGSGQLRGAVLDVTDPEPLPKGHAIWNHPRILLTPHIASTAQTDTAALAIVENIRRHSRGEDMIGEVKRDRGY